MIILTYNSGLYFVVSDVPCNLISLEAAVFLSSWENAFTNTQENQKGQISKEKIQSAITVMQAVNLQNIFSLEINQRGINKRRGIV